MIVKIDPKKSMRTHESLQNLCNTSYRDNPSGCPHYGKKETCPPHSALLEDFFDYDKDLFAVYTSFNLREFGEGILSRHPELDTNEAYNPKRWQRKVRKENRLEAEAFMSDNRNLWYTGSPEAHGVDVSFLMNGIGIELDWNWPPKNGLVYIVGLMGNRLDCFSWEDRLNL